MATITHETEYWTWSLAPGQSIWLSYGPDDRCKTGTVHVMCSPYTQAGDTTGHRTQTLSVPEVFNTQVPTVSGDLVFTEAYAGFSIFNRGNDTIKYFSLTITIVGP
jgi:hypothetical protein